ncbi:hypothetical protein B5V46_02310 [Rhodovulum sp. MB263]|nr:hypothetical protein B5V46_02310 [Rhodovulum sp. MB263]
MRPAPDPGPRDAGPRHSRTNRAAPARHGSGSGAVLLPDPGKEDLRPGLVAPGIPDRGIILRAPGHSHRHAAEDPADAKRALRVGVVGGQPALAGFIAAGSETGPRPQDRDGLKIENSLARLGIGFHLGILPGTLGNQRVGIGRNAIGVSGDGLILHRPDPAFGARAEDRGKGQRRDRAADQLHPLGAETVRIGADNSGRAALGEFVDPDHLGGHAIAVEMNAHGRDILRPFLEMTARHVAPLPARIREHNRPRIGLPGMGSENDRDPGRIIAEHRADALPGRRAHRRHPQVPAQRTRELAFGPPFARHAGRAAGQRFDTETRLPRRQRSRQDPPAPRHCGSWPGSPRGGNGHGAVPPGPGGWRDWPRASMARSCLACSHVRPSLAPRKPTAMPPAI